MRYSKTVGEMPLSMRRKQSLLRLGAKLTTNTTISCRSTLELKWKALWGNFLPSKGPNSVIVNEYMPRGDIKIDTPKPSEPPPWYVVPPTTNTSVTEVMKKKITSIEVTTFHSTQLIDSPTDQKYLTQT